MAEGNERSGKSYGGGHKGYGDRRPSSRGGNGFKPRGKGGFKPRREGEGFKPRYRDNGEGHTPRRDGDGENGHGGFRKSYGKSGGFHKGGFRKDGERGGFRKEGGFRRDGGFHKDGPRRDGGFRSHEGEAGENPRYQHRDGEHRDFRRDNDRRGFRHDGERGGFRRDNDRRDFHRDDRRDGERRDNRDFRRDGERNEGRGFRGNDDRRDFRRDNDRRNFRRDGERGGFRRDDRRDNDRRGFRGDKERRDFHRDNRDDRGGFRRDDRRDGERREFSAEEKTQYREQKRSEYMSRPRRNSDGTMSFPSQNPYTARRPDEPRMPKGMEWSMLSSDERERLRGLAKEHAENIGLHILAAYALEEKDPQAALEHAKWVARQASRIDFARETLAFIAYRQGNYKLALREFRTAYRMNGFQDYLPFIADCERGVGDPKKAVEIAQSEEGKQLHGAPKVEMFLVYAGALGDLKLWDKAIEIVHTVGRSQGLPGEYRMRAVQAEQYFLEEAGRNGEAEKLDRVLDRLEEQYADEDFDEDSDDVVIDHDLEELTDDSEVLEQLGIDPSEARFAPEPEPEDDESEDASDDEDDDEDTEESGDSSEDDSDDSGESDDSDESDESEDASEESDGSEEQSTVDDADSAESDAADSTDNTDADAETDTASDETSVSEEPEQ
ncbi:MULTISPECIES: lipopolysaccharide assembly protein LapB [unclassified Bifidobacterium]|uniref:tetratricopeptide repeat protein n=1 Tax=unclassified Bifidobacterium TaxID=2608897 RepID=UPI001D71D15C|nr:MULTISPECIES: hypothetical protein [unclassified Bifidobacterium]TPF79098.1 hypothetical protein BW09_00310 [Bifidobacterium sp. UTCIF-1]TPF80969.1 hypothetical protein BW08_01590 [Bifidobacterium sp. UTCIF-24]TPF83234.1 hypothetical protein BW12_00690 [Bifidobacterium sp. UTCIF-3]TPF85005.1 hypothetical protein BW07_01670 [Bifidobacterium sp. UTCIF-36]TPF88964.1 hypothetical protein BW10_07960 [Bifidobacterium sp. UTBIF-56]